MSVAPHHTNEAENGSPIPGIENRNEPVTSPRASTSDNRRYVSGIYTLKLRREQSGDDELVEEHFATVDEFDSHYGSSSHSKLTRLGRESMETSLRIIVLELRAKARSTYVAEAEQFVTNSLRALGAPSEFSTGFLSLFGGAEQQRHLRFISDASRHWQAFAFRWSRLCFHERWSGSRCEYIGSNDRADDGEEGHPHFGYQVISVLLAHDTVLILRTQQCPWGDLATNPNTNLIPDAATRAEVVHSALALRKLTLGELCRTIIDEECAVISQLEESLIRINDLFSHHEDVPKRVEAFREYIGDWRTHLHTEKSWSRDYSRLLTWIYPTGIDSEHVDSPSLEQLRYRTREAHSDYSEALKDVSDLYESIFDAMMQTMSIIESQKAILEAEYVTKLTKLAFFFIPLSFVAGVCGMNIAEFGNNNLKAWIWGVTSASVLAITYFVFYFREIAKSLLDFLQTVEVWFFRRITNPRPRIVFVDDLPWRVWLRDHGLLPREQSARDA